MQDDPVRVALLAATFEAETWQRDAAGRRRVCPADAMERMAAAAVAAFLRALPKSGLSLPLLDAPWVKAMGSADSWHQRLAAAVERAAKEAGE